MMTTVRLWDKATGRPIAVLAGHTEGVLGLAFSLETGSEDATLRLRDAATGRTTSVLTGHTAA